MQRDINLIGIDTAKGVFKVLVMEHLERPAARAQHALPPIAPTPEMTPA